MSEQELDATEIEAKVHSLAEAMDKARESQADRDDVVVEMKQAARARLELLAQELQPVIDDLPPDSDQFEFALTAGDTPRLWVDMTAFVRMGRDRRVYEFVKDTRLGRMLLFEGDDREATAKAVTAYVAERLLERERSIEGDWITLKRTSEPDEDAEQAVPERARSSGWLHLVTFVLGVAAGAIALVSWAWFGPLPL